MTAEEVRKLCPQRESKFQEQVIEFAKLHGWRVAWFRPVRVQRKDGSIYYETPVGADGKGWPDLVLVRKGRIVFAELKAKGGKPSKEQREWLSALTDLCQGNESVSVGLWTPNCWLLIEHALA